MKKLHLFFLILSALIAPFFVKIGFSLFIQGNEQEKLISGISFAGAIIAFVTGIIICDHEDNFPLKRKMYLLGIILMIISFILAQNIVPRLGL